MNRNKCTTKTNPNNESYLCRTLPKPQMKLPRSEEHTSELQSRLHLVCRLLLEKKKKNKKKTTIKKKNKKKKTNPTQQPTQKE